VYRRGPNLKVAMDEIVSCSCPVPGYSVGKVQQFGSATKVSNFNWLIILLFQKLLPVYYFKNV
jgi:hypothetical protein